MKTIHFYISNNNHHWQMMKPVMLQLQQKQVRVVLVSLCEFRRMETPEKELVELKIPFVRLASLKFKGASTSTGKKHIGGNTAIIRNILRSVVWHVNVKSNVKRINQEKPDLVVVPNDIAYPFDRICKWFSRHNIPFVLQQEGIRFPLPNEEGWITYGTNGAREILAWGEDSARYFRSLSGSSKVIAAGNPRFDPIFANNKTGMIDQSVLGRYNVLYVSNPVDDQGFCSHEEKINLFTSFLKSVKKLTDVHDVRIFVRLHPREDRASFEKAAECFSNVVWAQQHSLFDYLAHMDITVVLASTVGLESMMAGVPVAVVKLPRHGFVFNYVSSGCAIGIDVANEFSETLWRALTVEKATLKEKCVTYVADQLSNRGNSVQFISNHLVELLDAGH